MDRNESDVHINPAANALLNQLAAQLGRSKADVIEQALVAFEDRIFWKSVQDSFTQFEAAELRRERKRWDRTSGDGLRGSLA